MAMLLILPTLELLLFVVHFAIVEIQGVSFESLAPSEMKISRSAFS